MGKKFFKIKILHLHLPNEEANLSVYKIMNNNKVISDRQRTESAVRVTWIGFFVNFVLSCGKIAAGFFGRSSAMIADGIHSFSDFVTDLVVIVFVKIAGKGRDERHQYGHGKFETLATLIISLLLLFVAIGLFYDGITKVSDSIKGAILDKPSYLALIAALVSILTKEWLYRITAREGKKTNNQAVIANAWHHRSDAFSSIGTFIGIAGAMFLGDKWRVLDPIACIIVSLLILKVGIDLMKPAFSELLESSLPVETEEEIGRIIMAVDGVKRYHNLKTRKSGNYFIIDVHIKVDPTITIVAAHDIATNVEYSIKNRWGSATQVMVHTEPYFPNK